MPNEPDSTTARGYVRRSAALRFVSSQPPEFVKLFAAPLYTDDVEVIVTLGAPSDHRRLAPFSEPAYVADVLDEVRRATPGEPLLGVEPGYHPAGCPCGDHDDDPTPERHQRT